MGAWIAHDIFSMILPDPRTHTMAAADPRQPRIDIHCHLATPECRSLVESHRRPEYEPYDYFMGEDSKAHNKVMIPTIAAQLTDPAARIELHGRNGRRHPGSRHVRVGVLLLGALVCGRRGGPHAERQPRPSRRRPSRPLPALRCDGSAPRRRHGDRRDGPSGRRPRGAGSSDRWHGRRTQPRRGEVSSLLAGRGGQGRSR